MATIDERLEFLLQSTESLHASTQELHATVSNMAKVQAKAYAEHEELFARLALIAENHEDRLNDLEDE